MGNGDTASEITVSEPSSVTYSSRITGEYYSYTVSLLVCSRKVPDSNHAQHTGCPNIFRGFVSRSARASAGIVSWDWLRYPSPKSVNSPNAIYLPYHLTVQTATIGSNRWAFQTLVRCREQTLCWPIYGLYAAWFFLVPPGEFWNNGTLKSDVTVTLSSYHIFRL